MNYNPCGVEHHVESPISTAAWFRKKMMLMQSFFMISLSVCYSPSQAASEPVQSSAGFEEFLQ